MPSGNPTAINVEAMDTSRGNVQPKGKAKEREELEVKAGVKEEEEKVIGGPRVKERVKEDKCREPREEKEGKEQDLKVTGDARAKAKEDQKEDASDAEVIITKLIVRKTGLGVLKKLGMTGKHRKKT